MRVRLSLPLGPVIRLLTLLVGHNQILEDPSVDSIPTDTQTLNQLASLADNLLFASKPKTFVFKFNMQHQTIIQVRPGNELIASIVLNMMVSSVLEFHLSSARASH